MSKLFYLQSAKEFSEALVLGSGRMGVTAYGGINEDVYALNDDTLWSGYPRKSEKDCKADFEQVKKLVLEDKIEEAEKLTVEKLCGPWDECYLPAGNLVIKGDFGAVQNYKRTLSLDEAVHTVTFDGCEREAFANHPDDICCIRYRSEKVMPEIEVALESVLRSKTYVENGILFLEGEAPGRGLPHYVDLKDPSKHDANPENNWSTDHLIYSDIPEEKGMRYGIGVGVKTDGIVTEEANALKVSGATVLEIYVNTRTSFAGYNRHPYLDGICYKEMILAALQKVAEIPYETLKERHVADHSALFSRVELDLGNGREDLPTDERLRLHSEEPDLGLYALMYQFGRYLMIASSREGTQATNLQGIWNVMPCAPWSCNYTVNINTEMNYWGACGANLAECCKPLHEMIYELAETGKPTAKDFFGADGFCVNHNVDIWRNTHIVGEKRPEAAMFAYFPLAGAWLTRHLYDYYLETKDVEFLNGKAFDAIMGSARFCDSMLTEYEGKLIFTPATSPENRYVHNGNPVAMTKYSAMYQSIVRDAFEICIACCDITKRDVDYARYLEQRLEQIPWLDVTEDGRIMEWDEEKIEDDVQHRHLSHLYSFYPVKSVRDERLKEACKQSLNVRGDDSTGWSSAWKTCLWAVLGDGNRALDVMNCLIRFTNDQKENLHHGGGTYANLLCAHPPFQIDGNFGYVAGVNEMLAQEIDGELVLLPAIPDLWKNGSVKGLRVNGKTVNIEWRDGKIIS